MTWSAQAYSFVTFEQTTPTGGGWLLRIDPEAPRPLRIEGEHAPRVEIRDELLVVFVGELHFDVTLARELDIDPEAGPAGLIATGLHRLGSNDLLRRLRGEFALIVFDTHSRSVLVARDIVGVVPVYYAQVSGGLLLSPRIDSLLSAGDVPGEINRVALADFVLDRLPPLDETSYASVRRLPAASVMTWRPDTASTTRYWSSEPDEVGESDPVERLGTLLERAVDRSISGEPTAIFLSGGTDSAVVAAAATAVARRDGHEPPIAISLIAETHPHSEEEFQRQFAHEFGLKHVRVELRDLLEAGDFVDDALRMAVEMPNPISNPFLPVHLELLQRLGAHACRVTLDGGGGDELLGVDPSYAARLMRAGDLAGLYRFWLQRRAWTGRRAIQSTFWTYGLRQLLASRPRPHTLPSWLNADHGLTAALNERETVRAREQAEPHLPARDRVVALQHDGEFEETLRTGIRIRHPIRDPDVARFLASLSEETLSLGGTMKGLARAYLARELPCSASLRLQRVTARTVWSAFFDRNASDLLTRVGSFSALEAAGIVRPRALNDYFTDDRSLRQAVGDATFWNLLSAEAWLRARS
jgi:asparagine synthetase B (glutamine-hydrolysing)